MTFRWYILVISRHNKQDTHGSAAESLKELTRMMVTNSRGLSEQLQLKLRSRSLRESGNRDKSEGSSLFLYYEYKKFLLNLIKLWKNRTLGGVWIIKYDKDYS